MPNSIKNVLSVDMDYIVGDCINLYNDLVGTEGFREGNFWEIIREEMGFGKYLSYSKGKYELCKELVVKNVATLPKENVLFAKEHDMILELLCQRQEQAFEMLNVYNIDHHHDIYYDHGIYELEHYQLADLSNWVYYLGYNRKLYRYQWLRNEKSARFSDDNLKELCFIADQDSLIKSPEKLLEIDFDYVFVCLSTDFTPDIYWHLFDELRSEAEDAAGETFNVWDQPYCIGGRSRFIKGREPWK